MRKLERSDCLDVAICFIYSVQNNAKQDEMAKFCLIKSSKSVRLHVANMFRLKKGCAVLCRCQFSTRFGFAPCIGGRLVSSHSQSHHSLERHVPVSSLFLVIAKLYCVYYCKSYLIHSLEWAES